MLLLLAGGSVYDMGTVVEQDTDKVFGLMDKHTVAMVVIVVVG